MRTRLLAATVALALVAAACGGDEGGAPAATDGAAPGPVADRTILDFRARNVDGSTIDVGALAGTDVVVWFWAPW